MSKKVSQECLSEFEKQNSLANLCYFNFENTLKENITEKDKEKYNDYLRGICNSVYKLCEAKLSREQKKQYKEAMFDFDKDYINRSLTRDEVNIIYNNRISKLDKEQVSKKRR